MNIGLTGGIGCGKSTALACFREAGCATLDTDALVRDLLAHDAPLIGAVAAAFGEAVLDQEGKVDRAALSRTVFGNSEALSTLESLVHPRVREIWTGELRKGHPVLIIEIPLLFEKDLAGHFTRTLCLSCDPEVQRERLTARGMTEEAMHQRQRRQFSLEEKRSRADIILHNNGTPEHLREQVLWVLERLGCPTRS